MTVLQEFHAAVLQGDFARAQMLLEKLPPEPASRDMILWALETTRVRRAHTAVQLAELNRSTVYQPRSSDPLSSWSFDG